MSGPQRWGGEADETGIGKSGNQIREMGISIPVEAAFAFE